MLLRHVQYIARAARGEHACEAGGSAGSRCPVMRAWAALHRARGFTVVELLVVIAVVAVLISLAIPTLGRARELSRQTRELAGAQQVMTAFVLYSNDHRDFVLPGYPPAAWVNGPMQVLNDRGERLFNEDAQRYPWRLAPYLNFDFRGLYMDQRQLKEIREASPALASSGVGFDYFVSLFPALGMNTTFVGGSDRVQQFDPIYRRVFGKPYIERLDESRRPSELIAFASARADVQASAPILGRPEGFFRIEPPRLTAAQPRQWDVAYDAQTLSPGRNSGFVALRYGKADPRAIAAALDGHCAALDWSEMSDMRRWADAADREDWALQAR